MKALTPVLCLTLLTGCSRTPPGQQALEADTPISFAMWRSKNSDALTNKEWSLFNQALDELKLQIMLEGKASGGEAVDATLRAKLDGMKLRDVMREGLQLRLNRLSADKTNLEDALAINSKMKAKPGDDDMAAMLAAKLQMQSERLAKLKTSVADAEADLQQLELKFK